MRKETKVFLKDFHSSGYVELFWMQPKVCFILYHSAIQVSLSISGKTV